MWRRKLLRHGLARLVSRWGFATYTQEHLIVHFPGNLRRAIPMHVDLRHDDKKDVWVGRFHRGAFDMNFTLHRVAERLSHDQDIGPVERPISFSQ